MRHDLASIPCPPVTSLDGPACTVQKLHRILAGCANVICTLCCRFRARYAYESKPQRLHTEPPTATTWSSMINNRQRKDRQWTGARQGRERCGAGQGVGWEKSGITTKRQVQIHDGVRYWRSMRKAIIIGRRRRTDTYATRRRSRRCGARTV